MDQVAMLHWLKKLEEDAFAKGNCPGCPNGLMCSQGMPAYGRPGFILWVGYVHHPACTRPK